jgi:hypothetical protein
VRSTISETISAGGNLVPIESLEAERAGAHPHLLDLP